MTIWYKTLSGFSGSVILRNQHPKFSIPVFGFGRKCRIFVEKMFENQSEVTWVTEDILRYVYKKKEQKSQNRQVSHFHTYANFKCPYLKRGLCDLFSVLLEYNIISLNNKLSLPKSATFTVTGLHLSKHLCSLGVTTKPNPLLTGSSIRFWVVDIV